MKGFLIASICVVAAAVAAAQDPLSAARELYASAAYEEALTTLGRLQVPGTAPALLEQADQYRVFCFLALGRVSDAQLVAESLIRRNPTMVLDTTDVSPRLVEMFTAVRKRLMPDLIREHYRSARAAYERKDFSSAEPQLAQIQRMLKEAGEINVLDESLSDLGVLVDGFLDLARTQQANAEANRPAAPQPPAPAVADSAPAQPRPIETIVDQGSPDIRAPVAIFQQVPPVPPSLLPLLQLGPTRGILDVLIDEFGNVERSVIRQSINTVYDAVLLQASRQWKYQPAMKGQAPMKYLKTIAIVVQK